MRRSRCLQMNQGTLMALAKIDTSGSAVEEGRINSLSILASIPCDSMVARTCSTNVSVALLLLLATVSCDENKPGVRNTRNNASLFLQRWLCSRYTGSAASMTHVLNTTALPGRRLLITLYLYLSAGCFLGRKPAAAMTF